jgi:hypothetical protein
MALLTCPRCLDEDGSITSKGTWDCEASHNNVIDCPTHGRVALRQMDLLRSEMYQMYVRDLHKRLGIKP